MPSESVLGYDTMQIRGLVIFSFRNINFQMHLSLSRSFASHPYSPADFIFRYGSTDKRKKDCKNSVWEKRTKIEIFRF